MWNQRRRKRDNGGLRNSARQRNELERLENNELRCTKTTSAFLQLFAAPPKPNHSNNKIPTATQNFCSCFLEFNHTLKWLAGRKFKIRIKRLISKKFVEKKRGEIEVSVREGSGKIELENRISPLKFFKFCTSMRGSAQIFQILHWVRKFEGPLKFFKFFKNSRVRDTIL